MHVACSVKTLIIILSKMHVACFVKTLMLLYLKKLIRTNKLLSLLTKT